MKNKTYFSVEIYNGLTITGENQYEIKKYLYEMHNGFYELSNYYLKNKMDTLFTETIDKMKIIGNAIDTINNNLKH